MECTCEDIRRIVEEVMEEYVAQIVSLCSQSSRTKRKKSAYNIFMGECVKSKPSDVPIQERFKQCAAEYKAKKGG